MPAKVDESLCDACGACVDVCPSAAITLNDHAHVDPDTCVDCGVCVDECPNHAITLE